MKLIFLDIDGVLNCRNLPISYKDQIDDNMAERLKMIVSGFDAQIILISFWRLFFNQNMTSDNAAGQYIIDKLAEHGMHLSGMIDMWGISRGRGIRKYLEEHECDGWVVLDDYNGSDYKKYKIRPHLVKTSYGNNGGLKEEHVEKAINILNGQTL